jgi:inner membrane protein
VSRSVAQVKHCSIDSSRLIRIGPAALMMIVFASDEAKTHARGIVEIGVLDEPAHLANAGLVLVALCGWTWLVRHRSEAFTVLLCAVLIDVDHLPLYLGFPQIAPGGRPFSHSLTTVVALQLVVAVVPRRWRRWPLAAECGVILHLVRDVATGPGLPLFWPASESNVLLPYPAYAAVIVGLGLVATVRLLTAGRWRALVADPDTGP